MENLNKPVVNIIRHIKARSLTQAYLLTYLRKLMKQGRMADSVKGFRQI